MLEATDEIYQTPFWQSLDKNLTDEYFKAMYFYHAWLRKLAKKDYGRLKNTDEYIDKRTARALIRYSKITNQIATKAKSPN